MTEHEIVEWVWRTAARDLREHGFNAALFEAMQSGSEDFFAMAEGRMLVQTIAIEIGSAILDGLDQVELSMWTLTPDVLLALWRLHKPPGAAPFEFLRRPLTVVRSIKDAPILRGICKGFRDDLVREVLDDGG